MLEIKHLFIEHIGVVGTASNHQDEAQGNEDDADEHDDEILFAEGHDSLVVNLFFCRFLVFFFCHIVLFLFYT